MKNILKIITKSIVAGALLIGLTACSSMEVKSTDPTHMIKVADKKIAFKDGEWKDFIGGTSDGAILAKTVELLKNDYPFFYNLVEDAYAQDKCKTIYWDYLVGIQNKNGNSGLTFNYAQNQFLYNGKGFELGKNRTVIGNIGTVVHENNHLLQMKKIWKFQDGDIYSKSNLTDKCHQGYSIIQYIENKKEKELDITHNYLYNTYINNRWEGGNLYDFLAELHAYYINTYIENELHKKVGNGDYFKDSNDKQTLSAYLFFKYFILNYIKYGQENSENFYERKVNVEKGVVKNYYNKINNDKELKELIVKVDKEYNSLLREMFNFNKIAMPTYYFKGYNKETVTYKNVGFAFSEQYNLIRLLERDENVKVWEDFFNDKFVGFGDLITTKGEILTGGFERRENDYNLPENGKYYIVVDTTKDWRYSNLNANGTPIVRLKERELKEFGY